ncbi:MAG: metal-dependent hydrolase [Bacteroidota bacterium]
MDSVTQIVLGAAVGEAVLGKKVGNKAMLWGAIAGTVPDLDVFVKFFVDGLTADEMHRGFSHSLLFSVLFAPVLGWMAWKIHKNETATWKNWTLLMFLSLVTHPLLDLHTAWGTQFFWPLPYKLTYNNIFVIDPLYTVPFMIFVILAMRRRRDDPKRQRLNTTGLIISCSYMLLTLVFKGVAHHQFTKSLEQQHIAYTELESKPTPLNSLLWCGFVRSGDKILMGYYSIFDGSAPVKFYAFPQHRELLGHLAGNDKILRLDHLTRGWYVIEKKDGKLYFDDVRFGQVGFGNDPRSIVASRELIEKDGNLELVQRQPEFRGEDFGKLFKRIVDKGVE